MEIIEKILFLLTFIYRANEIRKMIRHMSVLYLMSSARYNRYPRPERPRLSGKRQWSLSLSPVTYVHVGLESVVGVVHDSAEAFGGVMSIVHKSFAGAASVSYLHNRVYFITEELCGDYQQPWAETQGASKWSDKRWTALEEYVPKRLAPPLWNRDSLFIELSLQTMTGSVCYV